MNYPLIFSIAKTHLVSRFKQSAVAALGVTFGIGTFITMIGFMTGLNDVYTELISYLDRHGHIERALETNLSVVQDNVLQEAVNWS